MVTFSKIDEGSEIFGFHRPGAYEGYINRAILTFENKRGFKVEAYEASLNSNTLYQEYFENFGDALQVFNNLVQAIKNLPEMID
ncbi:TPA: hypothetical protein JV334_002535 [Escherichia coli]|uniref:hypothetical protein n=1 Tax=Escherichia coli TaxID=562 RepID=UPI001BCEC7F4|nr:hypothetical protein [Escherichia coli]MBS4226671.1 hypothetical protein [Escherichia coli]MDO2021948.1 hypothetical protein [Escherichia coli]HAX3614105.1 hypothetical protein [Escherichia coli]HBB3827639.1 hypothetical protein [Escherichia coli]HCK0676860.1 hypothetical protein [Escherichia coli]